MSPVRTRRRTLVTDNPARWAATSTEQYVCGRLSLIPLLRPVPRRPPARIPLEARAGGGLSVQAAAHGPRRAGPPVGRDGRGEACPGPAIWRLARPASRPASSGAVGGHHARG